jgi:hypothetical protein
MKPLPILVLVFLAAATAAVADPPVVTTISSQASGTVRFFPNLGILDMAPVGSFPVQSTCFDTTGQNLEWRRGFAEFAIPVFADDIKRATIVVTDASSGFITTPVPRDVHEVAYYPGDLVVEPADFDRPATLIGTFRTDNNDEPSNPPRDFLFDVTGAVRAAQGSALGFRIKLEIDPAEPCAAIGFAGTQFWPITLEIVTAHKKP